MIGNRGTASQTRRNLLITMLLGGLWHGAAWTFILWGLYQGVLLILYRPFETRFRSLSKSARVLAWVVMFHLTCYGWLIFRAPSLAGLSALTKNLLFAFEPSTIDVTGILLPLVLYTAPLLVVHLVEAWADDLLVVPKLQVGVRYAIYVATIYLIVLFGNFGGSDFIYFQF